MTKSLLKKIAVACVIVGVASNTAFAQIGRVVDVVERFGADAWTFYVPAYQEVLVVVDGDGDTDLDCHVYDAVTGRFLGSDTGYTDYCSVRARSTSGRIRVEVDNLGSVWNRYEIRIW